MAEMIIEPLPKVMIKLSGTILKSGTKYKYMKHLWQGILIHKEMIIKKLCVLAALREFFKIIPGVLLITILFSSCNVYKSVNIGDVDNVDFKGLVDNKVNLELKVPVTNPNGYKIKITSMDLDVTVNGKYLGKMKNAEVITIPKKSDEIHNFPVNIYVKNLLGSMSVLYKMRKMKSFEMQIEGTIKVKAMLRSKTIEVSEKQRVSL